MNKVNIQPSATADAEEAATWYESQQPGLGIDFILELDAAIERAATNPLGYEVQYRQVRRVLLRRFPYSVFFVFESDTVEVFAILHQKRSPKAAKKRSRLS